MKGILYRIKHLSRRRRNRALLLLAIVNFMLLFLVYSNLFVYPNTMMGSNAISGKTASQLRKTIETQQEVTPSIQVANRTYRYRYDMLGVVVDQDRGVNDAFAPNRKLFPLNFFAFVQQLFSKRRVDPPLVFTQEFDAFITDTVFDLGQTQDMVTVDPTTKAILVEENSQLYRFDKTSLQTLLTERFGSYKNPIYPMLAKETNETISQIASVNQRLAQIFSSPILLYLDIGGTVYALELKEEDIREVTTVTLTPDRTNVMVNVNKDLLNIVIRKRVRELGLPVRTNLVTPKIQEDFAKAVYLRYGGTTVTAVSTKADDGPNTDGKLADKYIEVDISQAKMYLFKDRELYKSYKVSTGVDYPTPVGKFTILNKVGLGFSTIYNVWLPWWMGFNYSKELNAYFGIHEQPYTLTQDGKTVIADPRPIGTPSTGGCVALAPGAAREVYLFADVGTPVYIYE